MYVNAVGNSNYTPTGNTNLSANPVLVPSPQDNFEPNSQDAVKRLHRAGHRVGKDMLQEFIYTPQALGFIDAGNSTTLVPWGSIALRTEEHIYRHNDDFVQDSEIRKKIAQDLKTPDIHEVVWSENAGIIEAGTGMYGTLALPIDNPAGFGVAFNFGFDAVGLLIYRITRPCALSHGQDIKKVKQGLSFAAPWDLENIKNLEAGTEIQFVGKGKLASFEGVIAYEGFNMAGILGVASPGVGLYPVADQEKSSEYSLKILSLDGHGSVRVTIEKIQAKSAGITLRLMAGLLSPTNQAVPQLGAGALSYLLQTAIENPMQNMLMNTWTVSINANLSKQYKEDILHCFDLDLRNINHHEAYKNLISLNTKIAQELAADPSTGVTKVEWQENKQRIKRSVDVKAFTERLFLHEASNIKRSGKLVRPDNSQVAYCDKIYRKKFLNIFTGKKDIQWQAIKLIQENNKTQNYYAFFYSQLNRTPRQKQVSRFFAFAKALDINSECQMRSELINLSKTKKIFSSKDDINTSVELYFTEAGVNNILKAKSQDGMLAYLKTKCASSNKYALFPMGNLYNFALIQFELYYYYIHKGALLRPAPEHIKKIRKVKKLHDIKSDYEKITQRDFKTDFKLWLRAKKFGSLIEDWQHAHKKTDVSKFFTRIGRSESFRYEHVIAALANLANRENVLVHSFSMNGGGISIKSVDEGKITHPRDEAWELVNR